MAAMAKTNVPSTSGLTNFKLEEDQELRFEVASSSEVCVELLEGMAEMFGTELVQHVKYVFPSGSRAAIFTFHGCVLDVVGRTDTPPYVAKQTPMIIYVNTHAALESLRVLAASHTIGATVDAVSVRGRGPRAMIVGPTDVGKSTYCRILLNYAVRQQRTPVYVDLDCGQGSLSIAGTLTALPIERPADVVSGFDRKTPLVYHFGHASPGANIPLYNMIVDAMAKKINERCELMPDTNHSGIIINTCGWVKGEGYKCLVHAAEAFEVDVVIVLDHERLYNELERDLPSFVKIVHQPKSGGVEDRTREQRTISRRAKIRTYFYGDSLAPLAPYSFDVSFDEVTIVKMGAEELPEAMLPLGMKAEDHRKQIVVIMPDNSLQNHILAVSQCESTEITQESIVGTNVAGFVCVTSVNIGMRTLTLLSPQPYPLPRSVLLFSDITFVDDK